MNRLVIKIRQNPLVITPRSGVVQLIYGQKFVNGFAKLANYGLVYVLQIAFLALCVYSLHQFEGVAILLC